MPIFVSASRGKRTSSTAWKLEQAAWERRHRLFGTLNSVEGDQETIAPLPEQVAITKVIVDSVQKNMEEKQAHEED